MSELQEANVAPQSFSEKDEAAKVNALIAYGLMVVGFFTGIFWIIGAVWAMVKKEDAKGSIFEDHFSNIIKTFWFGLGLPILGIVLTFMLLGYPILFVGYPILFVVWIWSIYKVVKGLSKITANKAYSS
ncbi:DUF4870 family protein [Marinobacter sp. F4216]|uniref:DUF4870 family protein n=1 Tax=Marinobacter sp. F4216 TaxID=2874281 RepID=UPI001CBD4479|nr:hypothetical protein [Marinobacter sp. F4216]MBZ2169467.1 hypothetical protein [Marinobacter sp. F4216]